MITTCSSNINDGVEVDSAIVQNAFTGTDSESPDTVLLYDCCYPLCTRYPGARAVRTVVECLCAGGFESEVPIPGPNTFTAALVHELSLNAHSKAPLSVPELHNRLLSRLPVFRSEAVFDRENAHRTRRNDTAVFTENVRRTPIYLLLSLNRPTRTIFLRPINAEDPATRNTSQTGAVSQANIKGVLLAVNVFEDDKTAKEIVDRWLMTSPENIQIIFNAFHASCSTMVIVEVPVVIWDLLIPSIAVSFLGLLTGSRGVGPGSLISQDEVPTSTVQGLPSSSKDTGLITSHAIDHDADVAQSTIKGSESHLLAPSDDVKSLILWLDAIDALLPIIFSKWQYEESQPHGDVGEHMFSMFLKTLEDDRSGKYAVLSKASATAYDEVKDYYFRTRSHVDTNSSYFPGISQAISQCARALGA
jgi:hypothetical protein